MAATVPKKLGLTLALGLLATSATLGHPQAAAKDPEREAYRSVGRFAAALTGGSADEALTFFDKSFAGYEKIASYFNALASAYQVANELELTSQDGSAEDVKLEIQWTMTISAPDSGNTENRSAAVAVHLIAKKGKWLIVDFSPVELFNPAPRH